MWQLLIAVCAWAFANLFLKIARVHLSTASVFLWQMGGIILVTLMVFLLTRSTLDIFIAPFSGILWAFLGGAISIVGAYFFLESLGTLRLGIAVPFSSLHIVLTCILSILLLREKMTLVEVVGIVTIVIGSALLGLSNVRYNIAR